MRTVPTVAGGWPYIGHALAFNRNPVEFLRRAQARHGDMFWFRLLGRTVHALMSSRGNEAVILYLVAKHAVGYAQMPEHDLTSFLILYLPNVPWLTGNGFFAIEASRVMIRAVRRREQPA